MHVATRIRLFATVVFIVGIAMAAAGGTMSAWAWVTPDVHIAFRIVLPLATAWLFFTMVRLALALPRVLGEQERAMPEKEASVSSVEEITLPGRIARRTIYADGRVHVRVRPASRPRHVTPRRVAAALVLMFAVAGAVAMLEPASGGEWLAWLSD